MKEPKTAKKKRIISFKKYLKILDSCEINIKQKSLEKISIKPSLPIKRCRAITC